MLSTSAVLTVTIYIMQIQWHYHYRVWARYFIPDWSFMSACQQLNETQYVSHISKIRKYLLHWYMELFVEGMFIENISHFIRK